MHVSGLFWKIQSIIIINSPVGGDGTVETSCAASMLCHTTCATSGDLERIGTSGIRSTICQYVVYGFHTAMMVLRKGVSPLVCNSQATWTPWGFG